MNRLLSPDQLKAVSIFGVVLIHSASLLGKDDLLLETMRYLFRFAVPSFIVVWALFFEKSYAKRAGVERRQYIWDRFIYLFKIYLIYSLVYFFLTANFLNLTFVSAITTHFLGYGWSGQYFFIILFQLLFLYPIIRYLYDKPWLRYLTLFAVVVTYFIYGYWYDQLPTVISKLGDRPFFFWIPYVFTGIALARKSLFSFSRWSWLLVGIIPLEFYFLDQYGMDHSAYITPGVLIGATFLNISVLQRPTWFVTQTESRLINFVGSNTLTIFVANPLVILLLQSYTQPLFTAVSAQGVLFIALLLLTCLVIAVCLLYDRIVDWISAQVSRA